MENSRLSWADIAKGIGIILVVFAHTLVPNLRENHTGIKFLWIFIYNFHMPLFFFISGWLFEKNLARYTNKGKFIGNKARLLMLPYITFSVFAYAFVFLAMHIDKLASVLSGGGYGLFSIKDAVFGILFYYNHIDQHLWFVYSLFIVFIINILLPKIMRARPMLIVLLALYVSKAFVHYPAILDYTASDLFFFSLARVMFFRRKEAVIHNPLMLAAVLAVFVTANCVYSYFYVTEMPRGAIKIILYLTRALCSVSGILTICSCADYLSKTKLTEFFTETGMYSYDIYLMHAPFLVSGLMGILLSYSPIPAALCCITVTIIGIALPYAVSRFIIRKIPIVRTVILGMR